LRSAGGTGEIGTQVCEWFFNPYKRLFGAQYIQRKIDFLEKVSDAPGADHDDIEKITENELGRNRSLKQKDMVSTAR